jgi:hemoglobin
MKRHASLQPLSREHHEALLLAQLLKKDAPVYKGLPVNTKEKIAYACDLFERNIARHFIEEEEIIRLSDNLDEALSEINREILNEHLELKNLFALLAFDTEPALLDLLAGKLESHIRKEERVWYPMLQQFCDEKLLAKIGALTGSEHYKKTDIHDREDIKILVDRFYEKVKKDNLIGPVFNDVVKVNWAKHLPVMYDFWDNAIFFSGTYNGNPLKTHTHLNRIAPLTPDHFNHWVTLFLQTVDELFTGEKANLAKQKATSIAKVMELKVLPQPEPDAG